jgi:uncharacterized protein
VIYEFEYDQSKSEANKVKHGVDFVEAQELWSDRNRLIFEARSGSELRFGLVAKLGSKHWTAFWTMRSEVIRLISVRRARLEEIENYEDNYS